MAYSEAVGLLLVVVPFNGGTEYNVDNQG